MAALPVGASLWQTAQPWWEYACRAAIIYVFLLLVLRLTGKRQVGQLSPFDLVLLLVLSNAVQNSMNGGDNSVTAGVILVLTLFGLNSLVGYLSYRSKKVELVVEGKPQILVHNGVVDEDVLGRERISRHELMSAVRQAGLTEFDEVRVAILENNGRISVIGKRP
ncbi:MAG TPA: YetF domain-containing protein [Holophaga sp.]|nr:YetF domain-containing protein [Holophaga sp.]